MLLAFLTFRYSRKIMKRLCSLQSVAPQMSFSIINAKINEIVTTQRINLSFSTNILWENLDRYSKAKASAVKRRKLGHLTFSVRKFTPHVCVRRLITIADPGLYLKGIFYFLSKNLLMLKFSFLENT